MDGTKTCSKCKQSLPATSFHKDARRAGGLRGSCRACDSVSQAAYYAANRDKVIARQIAYHNKSPDKARHYYQANKEKAQAYYRKNQDKVIARQAAYRSANPDKERSYRARWRLANPDKERARHASYYKENQDKIRAKVSAYRARHRENLSDRYVRLTITCHTQGLKPHHIPVPLVKLQRARIKILRKLKEQKT